MRNAIIYFCFIFVLFSSCKNDDLENEGECEKPTSINFSNGYKALLNANKELVKIIKIQDKDTLSLIFFDEEVQEEVRKGNWCKKYFISNKHGLYKIKEYLSVKRLGYFQNQLIYIDTLSENFNISSNSNFIDIDNIRDTVRLNEVLQISLKQKRQVFSNFKIYIQYSNSILDLKYDNVLKSKEYDNKNGFVDTIKFTKKGDYYYQGFIENYSPTESDRPSIVTFFKKKIYVK